MSNVLFEHPADIVGYSRLAIAAVLGLTDLVETAHQNIALSPGVFGQPAQGATPGITGLVYKTIRGITELVGSGIDTASSPLLWWMNGDVTSTREREATLAVLNGIVGDHLAATASPLAIPMQLRRQGLALKLQTDALAAAIPRLTSKPLILVHGLCLSDLQWFRHGHDHGVDLSRDLGYTAVYLHYNTGMHISHNGREFAGLLEALVEQWPIPVTELAIVGHSMGGLVARSAYYYGCRAGHRWPQHLRKLVFLGTPHHGALLERWGNLINVGLDCSPYTTAFAGLGKIRSAGITDLRYGNLLDEDWQGWDRFAHVGDRRLPLQLPAQVRCHTIAALKAKGLTPASDALGDGVVPVSSALGWHRDSGRRLAFKRECQWVAFERDHFDLLNDAAVYQHIRSWLAARGGRRTNTNLHHVQQS